MKAVGCWVVGPWLVARGSAGLPLHILGLAHHPGWPGALSQVGRVVGDGLGPGTLVFLVYKGGILIWLLGGYFARHRALVPQGIPNMATMTHNKRYPCSEYLIPVFLLPTT